MRRPLPAVLFGILASLFAQLVVGAGLANSSGSLWVARVGAVLTAVVGAAVAGCVLERARTRLVTFLVVVAVPPALMAALTLVVQARAHAPATAYASTVGLWFLGACAGGVVGWRLHGEEQPTGVDAYLRR